MAAILHILAPLLINGVGCIEHQLTVLDVEEIDSFHIVQNHNQGQVAIIYKVLYFDLLGVVFWQREKYLFLKRILLGVEGVSEYTISFEYNKQVVAVDVGVHESFIGLVVSYWYDGRFGYPENFS